MLGNCLQAQMAYLAGNKAQAKQLSLEGRSANERMHAAHAAAAAAIYHQRNPSGAERSMHARTEIAHGMCVSQEESFQRQVTYRVFGSTSSCERTAAIALQEALQSDGICL